MKTSHNRQRRLFLEIITATGVASVIGSLFGYKARRPDAIENIARASGCRRSMKNLGQAYIEQTGSNLTARSFLNALCVKFDATSGQLSRMTDRSMRDRLQRSIKGDFINGKTVNLKGWVLSETEIYACAAVALHDSSVV